MNLIERAKNILLSPKTEWEKIASQEEDHVKVLTNYLIFLAIIPAVAAFIGYGVIGFKVLGVHVGSMSLGIRYAIMQFVNVLVGAYLTAGAFYLLAPNFGAEKNFNKAFQLAAYCYTAVCVGGVFYLMHSLTIIASLAALYALYLLYLGVKPVMKTPEDKAKPYFWVSLLCMIVVSVVVSTIMTSLVIGRSMGSFDFTL
jgi:Yip1 domain.